MASLRRIAANRKNAEKSTGPCTQEGKERSRRNALKHGLAGCGIVLPDEERKAVRRRCEEWHSALRPFDNVEMWLCERIALETTRLDRCARHDMTIRARRARRAGECWDEDRALAVAEIADGLARKPDLVARRLQRTSHGCDWLIGRWGLLIQALEIKGDWDEEHRAMALDLLGVPRKFREGSTPLDPPDGDGATAHLAAIARGEIVRLSDLKARVLDGHDGSEQGDAMLGLEVGDDPDLRLLRRYERSCKRDLEWAMGLLRARKKCDYTPPPRTPPRRGPSPEPESRDDGTKAGPVGTFPAPDPTIALHTEAAADDATTLELIAPVVPIVAMAATSPGLARVYAMSQAKPGNRRSRRASRRQARRRLMGPAGRRIDPQMTPMDADE